MKQDLYYVTCEWDIGLNLEGNSGCYSSKESLDTALNNIDLESLNYESLDDIRKDGMLNISVVKG